MSKKFEIELKENKYSEMAEIIYSLAGNVFPPFSFISRGYGLVNRQLDKENLNILKKHIEDLNYKFEEIVELNDREKRNAAFNVRRTIEEVFKTRAEDKIKIYGNALINGFKEKTVFNDDDEYEEVLEIISNLNLFDFELLRKIKTNKAMFRSIMPRNIMLSEKTMSPRMSESGFKIIESKYDELDKNRINKLISLGLVDEVIESNLDVKESFNSTSISKKIEHEKFYALSRLFFRTQKYIIPPNQEWNNLKGYRRVGL